MRLLRALFVLAAAGCVAVLPLPGHAESQHGASAHGKKPAPIAKPATSTKTVNPVAARISSHPQLLEKVKAMLPAGMTLDQASAGFKNEGQFIAALHVSRNLNIPFAQLQAEMTGKDHDSLGQAIHDLQPATDAKRAAKTAEKEADADVKAARKAAKASKDKDDR